MSTTDQAAVDIARDYYNSDDADHFYFHVWGGEDIHVGLYAHDDEAIAPASHRTVTRICLLYTSPSPRDKRQSRMPSSA